MSAFLCACKGDLLKHLSCNETELHSIYKRVHIVPNFSKLNANIKDYINTLANPEIVTTQDLQASQQSLQPAEDTQRQSQKDTPSFA
eukprot:11927237-Ditylum_brightwellii.AAC.1